MICFCYFIYFILYLYFLQGCTIKEAVIVGSVVQKVSIPVLHAAAALLRLAVVTPEKWLPSVSYMMNVLIDKKYSLPIQVRLVKIFKLIKLIYPYFFIKNQKKWKRKKYHSCSGVYA